MKIFVSFDFDHDRQYKFTLNMWNGNGNIDFEFIDGSTREIQSWDISRVKAAITTKIRKADAILVLVGEYADTRHKYAAAIGYRNKIGFVSPARRYEAPVSCTAAANVI